MVRQDEVAREALLLELLVNLTNGLLWGNLTAH